MSFAACADTAALSLTPWLLPFTQVGMHTWHHERNTGGVTVEMHGNVRHLVCPECRATRPMDATLAEQVHAACTRLQPSVRTGGLWKAAALHASSLTRSVR